MYQGPIRLSSTLLPALSASSLGSSVKKTGSLETLSSLYCHTVCADNLNVKAATPTGSTAVPSNSRTEVLAGCRLGHTSHAKLLQHGSTKDRTRDCQSQALCLAHSEVPYMGNGMFQKMEVDAGVSMGGSSSRLYSALAQSLFRRPLEPEETAQAKASDSDELLRECEAALRDRPTRLQRCFFFPDGQAHQRRPIRVMQWNVLAQALGEGKDSFVQCPLDALNWAERKYLILEEILTYRPDILCLQEVDHYFDTFQPALNRLGYHCTFHPKPLSPCLDVEHNNGPDGCALFFNRNRFELADSAQLLLAAATAFTNQVAIIQTLRCRESGRPLCVAVTHLKARRGWEALRSAQGSDLLHHLERIAGGTAVPLLVCGDFNAEPGEDVYRRFATSSLGLDSACKRLSGDGCSEPPYTTWKIRPSGESCHTLDYIWYSRHAFSVDSVLDFPTEEQIGPDRLPSYNYPSDHLSLVCDVSFRDEPDRLL